MAELVESARRAVMGEVDSDAHAEAALAQIIQVGSSAGGARAKAAVAWNPSTHEIRAGQFDVKEGFEHWLLKLDGVGPDERLGVSRDYGRIEYAYHLMARAAGITMSDCRLLEENGRAHFMTRRFDREGNRKHHLQTLCGLAHMDFRQKATHDVSQVFQVIERLQLGYPEKEEAFRRMVFNVLAANCDDHSKNMSFLLREGGAWELAPAYDLTHAFNPSGEWTYQHLMSVNGKFTADLARRSDASGRTRRHRYRASSVAAGQGRGVCLARFCPRGEGQRVRNEAYPPPSRTPMKSWRHRPIRIQVSSGAWKIRNDATACRRINVARPYLALEQSSDNPPIPHLREAHLPGGQDFPRAD